MKHDKTRLISRREAFAMFSAIGVASLAGIGGWSKNVRASEKTERSLTTLSADNSENEEERLKTIGVIGGLGPQATLDFENQIHQVAQHLIPPHQNGGYPPMFVYYCRHPPILLNEDLSPKLPIQPDPRLLEAAARVGAYADFLVITSNGAHLFQEQIERASRCKVLSMIDVTLEEVQRRKWKKIGVLGLGEPMVYTKPLTESKIDYETIDGELRSGLDEAILKVMEGRNDAESAKVARKAIEMLRSKNVDGIILGCTELPFLLAENINEPDLVNPGRLLAEAAVKYSIA